MDLIPDALRGTFTGFVNFGRQIGGFVAPIVIGIIMTVSHSFAGGFPLYRWRARGGGDVPLDFARNYVAHR